ncbi:MAG TPA: prenyltransferase [Kiritimatiellae bacterium]|nr:prenyltransferase [Kiritimatiellia bacterium]
MKLQDTPQAAGPIPRGRPRPSFLRLVRAPFISASVMPVLLGLVLARITTRRMDLPAAALTLGGIAAAHAAANLFNDLFDFLSGADPQNRRRTPLSGGSPYLSLHAVSPRRVTAYACAAGTVALLCWTALAWKVDRGWGPLSWIALGGGLLAVFYTAPPLRLAYRGLGELAIMVVFGPLLVCGAFYVQTGFISLVPVLSSLYPGLLAGGIILVNELPDIAADQAAGKCTLAVRLGRGTTVRLLLAVNAAAILVISAMVLHPGIGSGALGGVPGPLVNISTLALAAARKGVPGSLYLSQVASVLGFNLGLAGMVAGLLPAR